MDGKEEGRSKKYKCKKCRYETYNKSNLKTHINMVHENIRNHVCQECGNYLTKASLKLHMDSVHKMREQEFKCEQCSYTTFLKDVMSRHIEREHEKIKNHFCDKCDYGAYEKSTLKQHKASVHEKIHQLSSKM